MLGVCHPVAEITARQGGIVDNQEVLRVMLLRSFGEIERTCNHDMLVDHHDLIMRNRMSRIDERNDATIAKKGGRRILFRPLAFIENDLNPDAPTRGLYQGFGDGRGGERVCLHKNTRLGSPQGVGDRLCASTIRGKIYLPVLSSKSGVSQE